MLELHEAVRAIRPTTQLHVVGQASGLAAGKGVVVAQSLDEAIGALNSIMRDRAFGASGDEVVIEEFLDGEEASFFALVDDGEPLVAYGFEAAREKRFMRGSGLPIQIATVELIEIGVCRGQRSGLDLALVAPVRDCVELRVPSADGDAGVLAGFAEDLHEEIGGPIEDLGLIGKTGCGGFGWYLPPRSGR